MVFGRRLFATLLRSMQFTLVGVACSACALFGGLSSRSVEQVVYYVTTRAVALEPDNKEYYGSLRGSLEVGAVSVRLPPDDNPNSFAKTFNYNWADSLFLSKNKIPKINLPKSEKLEWVAPLTKEGLFEKINQAMVHQTEKRLLVYIHGFKRSFGKNVESGARLAYETAYPGPTVVFSWPSTNSISGYTADRGNAEWSTPYLTRTLLALHQKFPYYKIDLVAHSMGNRVLVDALLEFQELQPLATIWPFSQVVLLAPDIDRSIFIENYAAKLAALNSKLTIYVSAEDFPLMASGSFNAYPRLGDARSGVPIAEGIETIDVSHAITMASGHAYYRKSHEVSHDLYLLLNKNLPASERETLKKAVNEQGEYWDLLAEPAIGAQ
ncbi:hypothetical protein MARGE09_P1660 [Marinagarivorans cellulosilyticus]|uniref:Alpha/beta hydrolase n=2 Tax=Marinagarivorans cellulosilyticus TaxID=2721545 RepID=A0AAN2BJZ5_9GAMM|nr:hypothetical protein MARGE09_P1660 [Marinagarivorans cellulosilyticus]